MEEGGLLASIVTAEKELRSIVWSSFLIDDMTLFIKYKFTQNAYYLIITDTQSVWVKCCEGKRVVLEKETYAPSLVAPVEDILETLRSYFIKAGNSNVNGKSEVVLSCQIAETTLTLIIQAQLDFLKLEWNFNCELMRGAGVNPQLFIRDYFVLPLLAIANKKSDNTVTNNNSNNNNNTSKRLPIKRTRSLKSDELSEINVNDTVFENPTFPCDESSSQIYQQFVNQRCEASNIKRTNSTLKRSTTFLTIAEETMSRNNSFMLQYNSSDDEEVDKNTKSKKRRSSSLSFSTQHLDSLSFDNEDNGNNNNNNTNNNNNNSQPQMDDSQKEDDKANENKEDDDLEKSFEESPEELKRRKELEEKLLAKTKKNDKLKDRKKLLGI